MKKIDKPTYYVAWDAGDVCDSIKCSSLEGAKNLAEGILVGWMDQEKMNWCGNPTPSQIEHWNDMINECGAVVQEWDDATGRYETIWVPNCDLIGWKEIDV